MSPNRLSLRPQDLKQVLNRYLERLREYREALNRLNVYPVPDGDTGTNMTLTIEAVVAEVESAESITSRLGEEHADVAVDVVYGGQPLYPYLLGVE
ncbi:MAG: DAK2 domain-containing protein [Acidimicrobiia bacterium]